MVSGIASLFRQGIETLAKDCHVSHGLSRWPRIDQNQLYLRSNTLPHTVKASGDVKTTNHNPIRK